MNESQRLQLSNMVKINNATDQTEFIRSLKHSQLIRADVNKMIVIKDQHKGNDAKIHEECVEHCSFLFTYYTDIYNKIRKDELDIGLLNSFLDVLKRIENGDLDQHEGSFMVGTILKEMYVDSALKKAEKLNANEEVKEVPKLPVKKINYREYLKTTAHQTL
jgi:hypothetical protein